MAAIAVVNSVFQREQPKRGSAEVVHLGAFNNYVRVDWYRSHWVKQLESRLNQLTSLPVGWDGYQGKPVSFVCAAYAANLLERVCHNGVPPPSLVPGSDGTLQIEWHINNYDIEIEIIAPNEVLAYRFDMNTELEEEVELDNDFTLIAEWVSDLAAERRNIAASNL